MNNCVAMHDNLTALDKSLVEQLNNLPEKEDVSNNEEYRKYVDDLNELNAKIQKMKETYSNSEVERMEVNAELEDVKNKIASIANNSEIDKKIEELRASQIGLEQAKADSERILYLLSVLSQKKNELLTDEINKHFSIVKFKMFDYLKMVNTRKYVFRWLMVRNLVCQ